MKSSTSPYLSALFVCLTVATVASAADYRVEPLKEPAPAEQLSSEIASQLSEAGFRVIRGSKTTLCDIWLCRQWSVRPDFEAGAEVLYPFQPGQLVGVARFARRGGDFRDQEIAQGVYTLRYAQQPVDGAHVGTSPTRDFLLLVRAEGDEGAAVLEQDELNAQSAEAAESNHPCLLSLQRVEEVSAARPSMRHDDQRDWWIVGFEGKAKAGEQLTDLDLELVVVGFAEE